MSRNRFIDAMGQELDIGDQVAYVFREAHLIHIEQRTVLELWGWPDGHKAVLSPRREDNPNYRRQVKLDRLIKLHDQGET